MNTKGFTLVEILAVVMILGILTAIAVPQYQNAVKKARVVEAQVMLKALYDSSERLAASFGYDDYVQLTAALPAERVSIDRLDMFSAGLPAGASLEGNPGPRSQIMKLGDFQYKLMVRDYNNYLGALYTDGTMLVFNRTKQDFWCYPYAANSETCDIWGVDTGAGYPYL